MKNATSLFPKRKERMNKGDCGRVLALCSSYAQGGLCMCGAEYFVCRAAFLVGAGLVEAYTPSKNYPSLASLVPEAVFNVYGEETGICAESLVRSIEKADAVVLGCGIGTSENARKIVEITLKNAKSPLVIDADALNILSECPDLWKCLSAEQRKRTVITPHMKEMSRLCGASVGDILDSPRRYAEKFAAELGVCVLLKDHETVVTDGKETYINKSGNPGMATAGAGDVLAGVIGGFLAQRDLSSHISLAESVSACAYLHGRAGDIAAERVGEYSLVARDILKALVSAVLENSER